MADELQEKFLIVHGGIEELKVIAAGDSENTIQVEGVNLEDLLEITGGGFTHICAGYNELLAQAKKLGANAIINFSPVGLYSTLGTPVKYRTIYKED